jgi:hypothetical protein
MFRSFVSLRYRQKAQIFVHDIMSDLLHDTDIQTFTEAAINTVPKAHSFSFLSSARLIRRSSH